MLMLKLIHTHTYTVDKQTHKCFAGFKLWEGNYQNYSILLTEFLSSFDVEMKNFLLVEMKTLFSLFV